MHIKTNENTMFENLKMNFVGFFKKNIYDWKGSIRSTGVHPGFKWGSCCSIFGFVCSVLCVVFCRSSFCPLSLSFIFLSLCCLSFFDLRAEILLHLHVRKKKNTINQSVKQNLYLNVNSALSYQIKLPHYIKFDLEFRLWSFPWAVVLTGRCPIKRCL
jgi:hypothetical protein